MGTRAESKRQTREQLILAGMELFREQGLDAPSLDAICERAGKTRGALYVHFADREALQVAVMEHILMAYVATIVRTTDPAGDLIRTVDRFTEAVLGQTEGAEPASSLDVLGPDQLRLLLQGIHRSQAIRERFSALVRASLEQLSGVVSEGQTGRAIRDDIPAAAIAHVLVNQVVGLLALLETGVPAPEDVRAVRDAILTLLRPNA